LEFVDQNILISLPDRAANLYIAPDQRPHMQEEVVEVEDGCGALSSLIAVEQQIERGRQRTDEHCCDVPDQLVPGVGDPLIMVERCLAGLLARIRTKDLR